MNQQEMIKKVLDDGGAIWEPHTSVFKPRSVGNRVKVHSHVWIVDVDLPDDMWIQAFCYVPSGIKFGKKVFLGPRVTFLNDKYPPSHNLSETIVGDNVSIGGGAIILPGITIGDGAMIGAGSVVTKDVPKGATVYGNPARPHGEA